MTLISRFDPVREAMSLRNAMDQLLAQSFVNPTWSSAAPALYAPMNVYENDQGYKISVSVPGVRQEDIDVTLEQNTLTIKGRLECDEEDGQRRQREDGQRRQGDGEQREQREQREGEQRRQGEDQPRRNWLVREMTCGEFERSITFGRPVDAEHVEAKLENGVLTLVIPFAQSSRPRKISFGGQQRQEQIPVETGTDD